MYYGFDVGGTKIEFGAFNEQLERVATERVATPTDDYAKLVETIAGLVHKYDAQFGVEGTVGLGIPGMEDADSLQPKANRCVPIWKPNSAAQ